MLLCSTCVALAYTARFTWLRVGGKELDCKKKEKNLKPRVPGGGWYVFSRSLFGVNIIYSPFHFNASSRAVSGGGSCNMFETAEMHHTWNGTWVRRTRTRRQGLCAALLRRVPRHGSSVVTIHRGRRVHAHLKNKSITRARRTERRK